MIRSEERKEAAEEVLEILLEKNVPREEVHGLKTGVASENSCEIPSNEEVLEVASGEERRKVEEKLRRRPSRTKSGVSIVAVMTSPEKCPHGTCVPCPKGEGTPQSYVQREPAVMRARRSGFDPYRQTKKRLEQLRLTGHPTSKVDLIVMGGTFPAREFPYQKEFVKGCFDALNGTRSKDLAEAKLMNERADSRCVGLTVETRPDYCKEKDIERMLSLGTTRVELGVQIPDDGIYKTIERKHSVEDVVEATKLLKDSGLKTTYHYMPGLPGSNPEKDLDYFKQLFSDERFMPDSLKIYPTLVIENSELESLYRSGDYKPYDTDDLVELLSQVKEEIPPWVRVMRLNRDVPADAIVAGCEKSNLRQIVHRKMEETDRKCRCIRCREVGRQDSESFDLSLERREYSASGGKEIFLALEDKDKDVIAALLRLRFPGTPFREQIDEKTGVVRELHVYGAEVPVGDSEKKIQHRGFGKKLLMEGEKVARGRDMEKMAVTSGVGAREYYRKFGYTLEGNYMCKSLKD